jgi:hypothetical protein
MHGPTVLWCDIPVSRVWRCGNRGNVASVLIEKPARGNFLPIVDGGFSLQYSPLLEFREGRGRVVFCQLDVTGRTDGDPAAGRLVENLLAHAAHAANEVPRAPGRVIYAGEPAGLEYLRSAGFAVIPYEGGKPDAAALLVVGPGAGSTIVAEGTNLAEWLDSGGRLLALGCDQSDLSAVLPELRTKKAEHISAFFPPPPAVSPLAGVGPADVHNRLPRELPLVNAGATIEGDGVLAVGRDGRVVFCQMVPWQFSSTGPSSSKRTFRRAAFTCSQLLSNLGAPAETPLLDRFARPVAQGSPEARWKTGLYLDLPEEWDDPYRFFRW